MWTEFCHFLPHLHFMDSFMPWAWTKKAFLTPPTPSYCPRSYWMTAYWWCLFPSICFLVDWTPDETQLHIIHLRPNFLKKILSLFSDLRFTRKTDKKIAEQFWKNSIHESKAPILQNYQAPNGFIFVKSYIFFYQSSFASHVLKICLNLVEISNWVLKFEIWKFNFEFWKNYL